MKIINIIRNRREEMIIKIIKFDVWKIITKIILRDKKMKIDKNRFYWLIIIKIKYINVIITNNW